MLTVLHVMSRMVPSGTELQLVNMLNAAQGKHWEPTLCVLHPGYPLAGQVAANGMRVIELEPDKGHHFRRLLAFRSVVRSNNYDVVHTSLWGASAFARLSMIGSRRPAVVMSERRVEDFRNRPFRVLDRVLARHTDEWIGNSQDVCDFIGRAHRAPADRVHLSHNGIDTTVFRPAERPASRNGPRRIGAVGRLVEQKGFDVLLAALPAVLEAVDVEVVIVGEGGLRPELEAAAAGLPVVLPGVLDGAPAVAAFLQGLDLFVMPSRYEGLPNAVLEAAACGVRIVATDVPGMRAAVGPDVALVPADDAGALAAAIVAQLEESAPSPPPVSVPSFDEVAAAHRRVFERAVQRHAKIRVRPTLEVCCESS